MTSNWRTAHGTARRGGALVVNDPTPWDEQPSASNEQPGRTGRGADGRFLPGNPFARLAKMRAGPRGALAALEAKATPEWQAAHRWGLRAGQHRIREYAAAHGADLSHGVCVLLADAAEERADAKYIAARARAENNPDLLRVAAQLRASARQAERDAWELASREAEARPREHVRDRIAREIREAKGEPR